MRIFRLHDIRRVMVDFINREEASTVRMAENLTRDEQAALGILQKVILESALRTIACSQEHTERNDNAENT